MDDKKIEGVIKYELEHIDNSDLAEIQEGETKNWLMGHIGKAWDGVISTGKAIGRETVETIAAAKILLKILSGSDISDKEVEFLKEQSVDIIKALALIGLQAVPGSSVGIIALEKFAKSKGFSILPEAQNIPEENTENKKEE